MTRVRKNSPDIDNYIRRQTHPGYVNIFRYRAGKGREIFPDPLRPNLWGTETLGGDWNGRLLIVLKEFAPLHDLLERTDGRPLYSHRPDFKTNNNLVGLLREAANVRLNINSLVNRDCGLLIASASFLLPIGSKRSGSTVPDVVLAKSWPALEFTIQYMRSLTDIALCGVEAFRTFEANGGLRGDRLAIQASRRPVQWRKYRVHCTTHTQPTAINTRKDSRHPHWSGWEIARRDWRAILRAAFGPDEAGPVEGSP